ncbi:MAG: methyltransferase domain-containing protein [Dehalococcoidia bacterium]
MKQEHQSPQSKTKQLFGNKSEDYSTSSLLKDERNLQFVLEMAGIKEGIRVLDVATGTGFMAIAAADTGAEVLATDFTPAMLEKAGEFLGEKSNTTLALADADCLPFPPDSFDVVTCRVSVHHFTHPRTAFDEMARVCRPGGRVLIMDVTSSEDEARSELHNKMGKMRDPSEVRQWRPSELEQMLGGAGLSVEKLELWPHVMAFDEWIGLGQADEETAERLREMMIDSMDGDKAGLNPEFRDGELVFTWTTAIIVARK